MEEMEPQKSWWKRNWKWFVPLSGCFLLLIFMVVLAGGLFFGISSVMDDSDAYKEGIKRISGDDYVVSILGAPIEKDGVTKGAIKYHNGIKSVNLSVPIKGPNGKATLRVVGEAINDLWEYSKIEVSIEAQDTIVNVLQKNATPDF